MILEESYCTPPKYFSEVSKTLSSNSDSVLSSNGDLQKYFSRQDILVMYALGIDTIAQAINRQQKNSSTQRSTPDILSLENKINTAITLALTELNAAAAEFDCEGERIDQVAKYIDDKNAANNRKFTVGSIIVGAASAIASAFIINSGANKAVVISSGVLGMGLGFATLNPKGKKVQFYHKRNLLRDVWQQQENSKDDFAPFIWYMLNEKSFSNSGEHSLLFNLKRRWINYQFSGKETEGNKSIIFTDGGIYTADDLHARAAMINQMQAVIRSLNQNLVFFMMNYKKWQDTTTH